MNPHRWNRACDSVSKIMCNSCRCCGRWIIRTAVTPIDKIIWVSGWRGTVIHWNSTCSSNTAKTKIVDWVRQHSIRVLSYRNNLCGSCSTSKGIGSSNCYCVICIPVSNWSGISMRNISAASCARITIAPIKSYSSLSGSGKIYCDRRTLSCIRICSNRRISRYRIYSNSNA